MPPLPPPPKPVSARPPISMPAAPPPVTKASPVLQHTPKTFSVKPWTGSHEGEKILMYAANGMGKTTLAAMAPGAVFIGLDDGARKIKHPKTGADLNAVPGVETFQDLRDALHQSKNWIQPGQTFVLDTLTDADALGVIHTCATVKHEKGHTVDSLEGYGYGKGYNHLVDTMRLLGSDLEPLVRRGVHVLLLAQQGQATVSNLEGVDYLKDGPMLTSQPKKDMNVRAYFMGWVDNIFRISYPPLEVVKANKDANKGKASGTTQRIIYTQPEVYFEAKNRSNGKLPPVVAFDNPTDDSLWQFMFPNGGK